MVSPRRFGDSAVCDSSSPAPEFPEIKRLHLIDIGSRSGDHARASSANAMQHRPYRLQRAPIRFEAPRRGRRRNASAELEVRIPPRFAELFSGRLKPRGNPQACERAVLRARSVQEMIRQAPLQPRLLGILNVVDGTAHVHRPRRAMSSVT